MKRKFICIFCGAGTPTSENLFNQAKKLANLMVKNNYGLVYGGASIGLMGLFADEILKLGGEVIGVMPKTLVDMEVAHDNLSELIIVNTMHERKQIMYDKSDSFIAFAGGFGTLDELFEIVTWRQLNLHQKKVYVANIDNYFDGIKSFITNAVSNKLIKEKDAKIINFIDDVSLVFN